MKKTVTVKKRKFYVEYSVRNEKWKAVAIEQPSTNNQLYTLPAPWSCEADTEEDLNQKLNQHFEKIRKKI